MAPETSQLEVRDPYTGKTLSRIPFATRKDLATALERSRHAFRRWRESPAWERAGLLDDAAEELRSRHEEFAQLISNEAGKPIVLARGEVERAIGVLRWASGEAQRFAGELLRLDAAASGRPGFGIHTRFPRGVVLGITPFNFPLNLAMHKIAPAIAAGCSIIVKPSPFAPLTAFKALDLFSESSAEGLVQVLMADDASTEELTRSGDIDMVSFTGSARVGSLIRRQAPEKPMTLELGGNAWVIIAADVPSAQFPRIIKRIVAGAFGYAGQSCISVQNIAVAENHLAEFSERFSAAVAEIPFGNPTSPSVVSGPVIHEAARKRLEGLLGSLPRGARLVQSSRKTPGAPKDLIPPTLVLVPEGGKPEDSEIVKQEIFGPVANLIPFRTTDEVVSRVNSGIYGLQAGVFSQDLALIQRLYHDLEVGGVVVNDVPTTRYDHQPYGGVKESGQGREGVRYAMEEMTTSKFLALSSQIP